jgi:RNA-binding protein
MLEITPAQRRTLRAQAHHLAPVVSIGQHGVTPSVQHEIDLALLAHELIKVKAASDDREARATMLAAICSALGCAPVQHLGKVFILWRANPEKKAKAATRTATEVPAKGKPAGRNSGKATAYTAGSAAERPAPRSAKPGSREARGATAATDESRGGSRRRATAPGGSASKERKPAAGGQGLPYFSRRGAGRFVAGTPATPAKPAARRRGRGG